MALTLSKYNKLILCLKCKTSVFILDDNFLLCNTCGAKYHVVSDKPVMIGENNPVFSATSLAHALRNSYKKNSLVDFFRIMTPRISVNLSRKHCCNLVSQKMIGLQEALVLVVGSGKQKSALEGLFSDAKNVAFIYCDIDKDADVDFYCDAHELPFQDSSFDAVITTAVLQHVLYPERAVAEIHRVLKSSGLIYSEMAFMQQVIEGAYDFTRYSLSGHRRLFNHFEEIEAGLVAGPATAFVWSIENFMLAFFRRPSVRLVVKTLVRVTFFWIKYIDYVLKESPQALDGASCTFFLGSKRHEQVPDNEIISRYSGCKHLEHI